ncbi:hypothetical protein MRX96_038570 [Rhipicephalus microplus]
MNARATTIQTRSVDPFAHDLNAYAGVTAAQAQRRFAVKSIHVRYTRNRRGPCCIRVRAKKTTSGCAYGDVNHPGRDVSEKRARGRNEEVPAWPRLQFLARD